MVRINLLPPKFLTDQHLIAEYNEILMLAGHVQKHPKIKNQPTEYCLGPGHINFFKDKLSYLQKRHNEIKSEMRNRKFQTNKSLKIEKFPKVYKKSFTPKEKDFKIIKQRIKEKINLKPDYYRYYSDKKSKTFLLNLLR